MIVLTLHTGFRICLINNAIFLFLDLSKFKTVSRRTDITVIFAVINEFVMVKIAMAVTAINFMAYTWGYIIFVKVFIIFSDAVSFVSGDRLDFF